MKKPLKQLDAAHPLRLDLDNKLYNETVAKHPELNTWASWAREWLATVKANKSMFRSSSKRLLTEYLPELGLPTDPKIFLQLDFPAPSFYEKCLKDLKDRNQITWLDEGINRFIGYVLATKCSVVDLNGQPTILPGYGNPIPPLPEDLFSKPKKKLSGGGSDLTFRFVLKVDPKLESWRALAEDYLQTVKRGTCGTHLALGQFLVKYIHGLNLPRDPAVFLKADFIAPCLFENVFSHLESRANAGSHISSIRNFIDHVLVKNFSSEDDNGKPLVSPEFCNPFLKTPAGLEQKPRYAKQESTKEVLPYKFIGQLRTVVCPNGATSFADWKWAQGATDTTKGGDWVYINPEAIDKTDPDCVWRKRKTSGYERDILGLDNEVYEIWSPARSVALYVKLQLPLRTFQVRMLMSGEEDTKRYIKGEWGVNDGPLATGSLKHQVRKGVFREIGTDNVTKTALTGLFINTNKTADSYKDELGKGYVLPWQHEEVLFWLEKLRNWQERYNPIAAPVAWTELTTKQLEKIKSVAVLKEMGSACFLFRHASGAPDERNKPMPASCIEMLWTKALAELQSICKTDKLLVGGKPLEFVTKAKPSDIRPLFPLHTLRVSLITAYALEGGVPMPVLSRCIAGHSRLIMTLYYTKAGISYVTDKMREAETKLIEAEQANFMRWLRDATHKQLESGGAFTDPQSLHAVLAAQASGASLVKDDKGICPKGAHGCHTGGIYTNDETGVVAYGVVPGYPQKNCVRCRWFFSGPAFIHGLADHWNYLSYEMSEVGERIVDFEEKIVELEDEQLTCDDNDLPFMKFAVLDSLRKYYQTEIEANNKLATDCHATLRLITRCKALLNSDISGEGVQLVAVGSEADVQLVINECPKLLQILTTVAGSIVYAEHDVSKNVLQAANAYDLMLANNNMKPVLFSMEGKQLKQAVQHITMLLQAQTGSLANAMPFIEGERKLIEIGFDLDMLSILEGMGKNKLIFNKESALGNNPAISSNTKFSESHLLEAN